MKKRLIITGLSLLIALNLGRFAAPRALAYDPPPAAPAATNANLGAFRNHLETIRQTLRIPGMSVAVVHRQEVIFAEGFGYANLEDSIPATPDSPYGLASVTKPVAAVLIMQLVEEDLIDLDSPATRYGVELPNSPSLTVRHLLTHTSDGTPGTGFYYDGNRYGLLGGVIQGATGATFSQLLSQRILLPLHMQSTALNPIESWGTWAHHLSPV